MRVFILLFTLLLSISVASATSIILLAASEESDFGSLATAKLETQIGSGKVFIQTNLLSNEDTQHSIRMAKQIICSDYVDDCDNTDFHYTLQTNSPIITGPSAGAAIAILTFSHLEGLDVPQDISMSGTINSGGFIGTVGGLKAKITAAANAGLDTVYIPIGNRFYQDFNRSMNQSVNATPLNLSDVEQEDLLEFGDSLGISVKEAGSINYILEDLYEIDFPEYDTLVPPFYNTLMAEVALGICSRANDSQSMSNSTSRVEELLNNSELALSQDNFYSAASYCFGANILLREDQFLLQNFSDSVEQAKTAIARAESSQKYVYETINDIQIYAVVQERILDAKNALDEAVIANDTARLAYAYERAQTAISWQTFYKAPGSSFVGGTESLSNACSLVIEEAEQRIQYIRFYLPIELGAQDTLNNAESAKTDGDYPLCIFYALQAKAQADSIGSVFGTTEQELQRLLDVKSEIASRYVASQTTDTHFPIIGYSYLEYGSSLRESDPYAALLYYQMAQELSAIDLFLDVNNSPAVFSIPFTFNRRDLFLLGVVLGLFVAMLTYRLSSKKK